MKICSMCRNQVSDNYNTCPNCGNTNLQYIPEQQPMYNSEIYNYQNTMYGNQQMYNGQPMMNQYYQPVRNKNTAKDIIGAIANSIGLYYCLNLLLIITGGFQSFYDTQIQKTNIAEYKDNAGFWAFSLTFIPIICGLIAFLIGLSGRKQGKKGINTYNFVGGIINFIVSAMTIIYIINFFS